MMTKRQRRKRQRGKKVRWFFSPVGPLLTKKKIKEILARSYAASQEGTATNE